MISHGNLYPPPLLPQASVLEEYYTTGAARSSAAPLLAAYLVFFEVPLPWRGAKCSLPALAKAFPTMPPAALRKLALLGR